jgi:ABC-2 type transport system permease protein
VSTQTSGASGVIHNIGYRRYEGQRLGRFDIVKALYSQTLRGSYGIGRGVVAKLFPWFLVGCTVIPAFIIIAVETQLKTEVVEFHQYPVFIQMIPALFIAVQAPQAVSRDLRFHTLPLYFSRPLSPGDYVKAKFAGVFSGMFLLLAAPLVLLYLGSLLIKLPFGSTSVHFLGALFGVALLALLLTGIGLLLASVTPRRGLGVAAIIAVVVGSYGTANMLQSVLSFGGSTTAATWASVASPVTMYDMAQSGLFHYSSTGAAQAPNFAGGVGFTIILLGVTAVCYALLLVRYRKAAKA